MTEECPIKEFFEQDPRSGVFVTKSVGDIHSFIRGLLDECEEMMRDKGGEDE